MIRDIVISIHAPARGASKAKPGSEQSILISIHAPARGASAKNANFAVGLLLFLCNNYIFTKLILSNSKYNQYRPYICAIFIAPISWDFMYGKYMRKIL